MENIWQKWIELIMFLFWTEKLWSTIILIITLIRIFSFLIILPLHRRSLRKQKESKIKLTASVDNIIYQLAKAQYNLSKKQTLQFDPCFALLKTMFDSGHFEYIDNLQPIKENIKKVETLLKQTVISEEQWKEINLQKTDLKRFQSTSKILWLFMNIVTLYIYKLFR